MTHIAIEDLLFSGTERSAVLFDLDGVVTHTATLHAQAWKEMFDAFLKQRASASGAQFVPFDAREDYAKYVDGKPRLNGVEDFLASRDIALERGTEDDSPEEHTLHGLGNKKNHIFQRLLAKRKPAVYASSVNLLTKLKDRGVGVAVVSSSKNCQKILQAVQLEALFDSRVDGVDLARMNLSGKPHPDMFLEAAKRLGVKPANAIVVEDSAAGVEAGRRGKFAFVIGVNRQDNTLELREKGADLVVDDLAQIPLPGILRRRKTDNLISALEHIDTIARSADNGKIAVFLDYDGTLSPIVPRPEDAVPQEGILDAVKNLAQKCQVAVVSGRSLSDLMQRVNLPDLVYAGSHGFRIVGPDGLSLVHPAVEEVQPELDFAEKELRRRLENIEGADIERKDASLTIHYRRVSAGAREAIEAAVTEVSTKTEHLRREEGKMIHELRPRVDWDKGEAVRWIARSLGLDQKRYLEIYIGDDITDEDAFKAIGAEGFGIIVREESRYTSADFALESPEQVRRFLLELSASI